MKLKATLALLFCARGSLHAQALFAPVLPALPQANVDVTIPPVPGTVRYGIATAADFQSALNAAVPGDEIQLQAGVTYTGNFTLPAKSGGEYITITTAGFSQPDGTRLAPGPAIARIVTPNSSPALATVAGSSYWYIRGVEITLDPSDSMTYSLLCFGQCNGSKQVPGVSTPHHLVANQVYIHGGSYSQSVRRGVVANCASCAVVNSEVNGIWYPGFDSQSIVAWDGPGPMLIQNNDLQAASENLDFGGAMPTSPGVLATDVTIRGNHIWKPMSWIGKSLNCKNLLEIKSGQRFLIEGNVLENNWLEGQNGTAILFTVRTGQSGPWAVDDDITVRNNVVRRAGNAFNIAGYDSNDPAHGANQANRILIENNLLYGMSSGAPWNGPGSVIWAIDTAANVTIRHNTGIGTNYAAFDGYGPNPSLYIENNLLAFGVYGITGVGTVGGTPTLTAGGSPWYMGTNAVYGAPSGSLSSYPTGNAYPAAVAFGNPAAGYYALSAASPLKGTASDGSDPGVDWVTLVAETAWAVTGAPWAP